jgi:predicted Zn-dependent peptidase
MAAVVKSFKDRGVTQDELNEYRNIFTTSYFLTLESHGSLAGALSSSQFYFGDAQKLYEIPDKMAAVTPGDIQRIAKDVLKNFRIGVVYDKEKFDTKWLDVLTKV